MKLQHRLAAIAASIAVLFVLSAPPPAQAQSISQYSKTVSVTSANTVVTFGLNAVEVQVANDGAQTVYVSYAGVAISSDTASVPLVACETGTWYFLNNGTQPNLNIVAASGQTATARVSAFTVANVASPNLKGSVLAPSFVKTNHCSTVSGNETISGNQTVAGTEAITGAATFGSTVAITGTTTAAAVNATTGTFSSTLGITGTTTAAAINGTTITASAHLNDSSTTASRMLNTDASKNLVSNAAVTTNALLKSVSSGASSAASALSDDGTNVTSTEPILANASIQGNYAIKALTSGAAAAAVVVVTVPSGTTAGGKLDYCFEATDNTDFQARCGIIPFSAVNKAGTTTCTVGTVTTATEVVAVSAGTLTATWSCADGGSGALQLKATDTSSLTIGAGYDRVRYRVYAQAPSALVVTAQ